MIRLMLLAVILFFSNLVTSRAQNFSEVNNDSIARKIKKITKYKWDNDSIINIKEYDKAGNIIFVQNRQYVHERWKGGYLITITASEYDEDNKLIKRYNLHSNVGHSISTYNYDSVGNKTHIFIKENEPDSFLANSNPYFSIYSIKSFNELKRYKPLVVLESKSVPSLSSQYEYDDKGYIIKEIDYEANGDTISIRVNKYDEEGNNIYFSTIPLKRRHGGCEYYYEYEKLIPSMMCSLSDEKANKKEQYKVKPKLLQSVRLDYDVDGKKKKVSDITFYKYDDKNREKEEVFYSSGVFEAKVQYQYNEKGELITRLSHIYNLDALAVRETFEYDEQGSQIWYASKDYRSNENKIERYRYAYEYFE